MRGRSSFGPKNRSSLKFRFLALSVNSRYSCTGFLGVRNSLLVRSPERGVFRFDTPVDGVASDVRICSAGLFMRSRTEIVGILQDDGGKSTLIETEAIGTVSLINQKVALLRPKVFKTARDQL